MKKEVEKYHGSILLKIIRSSKSPISFIKEGDSSYIINEKFAVYIKYSKKQVSPWTFIFRKDNQDEISSLNKKYDATFICLVCHNDGIVCLKFEELKFMLDYNHEDEWVKVSRGSGKRYSIHGSDGKLKKKKGNKEFPEIILEMIK